METLLTESVQNSLGHFMYHNAIFMCERLCAEFPSETNMQLLAGCYLHNQQAYAAYHLLKGTSMAQSRYLFALSCFHMGLLTEAETALCPPNEPTAEVPNGASGHYLLGLIYRYTDRRNSSIHHFNQALLLDPLLWAAYEELCILGAAEEAAAVFGEASLLCIQKQHIDQGNQSQNLQASTDDQNVGFLLTCHSTTLPHQWHHSCQEWFHLQFVEIFSKMELCIWAGADNSPRSTVNSTIQAPRRKFVDEGKLRKISGRLFSDSGPRRNSRLSGESTGNTNSNVSAASGNGTIHSSKFYGSSKLSSMTLRSMTSRKTQSWAAENYGEGTRNDISDDSRLNMTLSHPSGDARPLEQEGPGTSASGINVSSTSILSGASDILSLFRILGEGYRLSCLYRCQDALDVYNKLPHKHYHTGWVLSQIGRAYFEMVDYQEADHAFGLARLASPYSLEGMDLYSTVLFHLKEDMKLSYLAQELVSTDRLVPQSWCAMGNCYSLQKDHETALKNFQRAVQLNPRFAYGHTLCGHEYVALEDFENAIKSYQSALRVDARHYNAWYGLGMIYLRQEKFEFSEHHFRMALGINPQSSVIMSYLGTALHALKKNEEALEVMELAIVADKKNPLPMYQKANILVSTESFDAALEVLEELKEHAPRESSVYALMGRIYKRRNMYDKAMLHFGVALDLKPSATDVATIKAAIEKLHVPDEMEDEL
ncbi:hypothetical protein EJD97_013253 [Solanum chilense]|uniref:Cdc23 domain-containing protein n=1 Tax=Solanum chilense TaxID=4083 RepID=A0A6N2C880_SOLCI|nr:hypothetical protein EJD97_013253 [Solanum chilense]